MVTYDDPDMVIQPGVYRVIRWEIGVASHLGQPEPVRIPWIKTDSGEWPVFGDEWRRPTAAEYVEFVTGQIAGLVLK